MTTVEKILAIQNTLGVTADGVIGPRTRAAFEALSNRPNTVKASSFADPADVVAFRRCKAQGKSDQECFNVGDNGKGAWGHDTAQDHTPMCALPREVWKRAGKKGGAKVRVTYRGKTVDGILGDTMPSLANVKNGAGIDLNPAFAKALGLTPPFLVDGVTWEWI